MPNADNCVLTTKDHAILKTMLERCLGAGDPLRPLLESKLRTATVMFREDIPPAVVTLGSRVTYSIDDEPEETRTVVADGAQGTVGSTLPITHPRGLALIGLSEGQSLVIRKIDGGEEKVTVEQVLYQPEAARHAASRRERQRAAAPAMLRVVHRSEGMPQAPAARRAANADPGFDDPGPSAA